MISLIHHSNFVSEVLGKEGIYTWDGDFYAITLVNDVLKLGDQGGLVRIGIAPYNTMDDITRTIEAIKSIANDNTTILAV